MKKPILTSALVLATIVLSAQIKIYTGGSTIIGATPSSAPTTLKFHIVGNTVFSGSSSTSTFNGKAPLIRGTDTYGTATTPEYSFFGNDQTGIFHPAADVLGFTIAGSEKMRIHSDGNTYLNFVGFGGLAKLNVYNSGGRALFLQADQTIDWQQSATVQCQRGNDINWVVNLSGTGGGDKFFVHGTGAAWSASANGYLIASDIRLKTDIKTIEDPLKKLLSLRGVTFKMKDELSNPTLFGEAKTKIGLIAQEVEKIIPEVVVTGKDDIKAVSYSNLVALCIEAIKEQNKTIENLKSELESIKNTNLGIQNNSVTSKNKLSQNAPNPFTEKTSIQYFLDESAGKGSIVIYNLQGEQLKSYDLQSKGNGVISISGKEFKAGMYIYALIVDDNFVDSKRMILTNH